MQGFDVDGLTDVKVVKQGGVMVLIAVGIVNQAVSQEVAVATVAGVIQLVGCFHPPILGEPAIEEELAEGLERF